MVRKSSRCFLTASNMYKLNFGVVCLFGLLMTVIQARPASLCVGKAKDILFVLDSSTSIWIMDYEKQLGFVADLVDSIKVENGKSQVRVGIITFSNHSYVEVPLAHYSDPAQMNKTIHNIIHRTGYTYTAQALELARTQLEAKLENRKGPIVVIVITDGMSIDREATKTEAQKLHQLGINVYAIGVGNDYNIDELKAIASDPMYGVYTVSSYSVLKEITQKFHDQPCDDERDMERDMRRYMERNRPSDGDEDTTIIFSYNSMQIGSYRVNMISQFINTFLTYKGYGHFGVVSHASCPEDLNIPVTSLEHKTNSELNNSVPVNVNIPGLVEIVRQMRSDMSTRTSRNVNMVRCQVAVLFVDLSVNNITKELIEETKKLKEQGVKLFVISVGQTVWPHPQYLQLLSSQPYGDYLYNYTTYEQLLHTARYNPVQFKDMYNRCTPDIPLS